ncbi:hypothetical protein ACFL6G_07000, partial [candidate division KSB1 bacterium]
MPSSHLFQVSKIVELISILVPQSVLDIGFGFGKYGFLCREYLELWDGRNNYSDWQRRIDGIEVHREYVTDLQRLIYNNIYIGEANDLLGKLDIKYDLMLLIDVLEHFSTDQGKQFISDSLSHCKNILISTPKEVIEQGDIFDNKFEQHKSQWDRPLLRNFGPCVFVDDIYSYICFIGEDIKTIQNG